MPPYQIDMEEKFRNIELSESNILGWKITGNVLSLYVDFLLTDLHEKFVDFNKGTEFGCNKIGVIKFHTTGKISGFTPEILLPKWNEELGEYYDICEIDCFLVESLKIRIEADEYIFSFVSDTFEVDVLETDRFEFGGA